MIGKVYFVLATTVASLLAFSLHAQSQPTKSVNIAPGEYVVTEQIIIPTGKILSFNGTLQPHETAGPSSENSTVIRFTRSLSGSQGDFVVNSPTSRIRNCVFDFGDSTREGFDATGSTKSGILINNANTDISDNFFLTSGTAITTAANISLDYMKIHNNWFTDAGGVVPLVESVEPFQTHDPVSHAHEYSTAISIGATTRADVQNLSIDRNNFEVKTALFVGTISGGSMGDVQAVRNWWGSYHGASTNEQYNSTVVRTAATIAGNSANCVDKTQRAFGRYGWSTYSSNSALSNRFVAWTGPDADATKLDTDFNGISDSDEIAAGTDPMNWNDPPIPEPSAEFLFTDLNALLVGLPREFSITVANAENLDPNEPLLYRIAIRRGENAYNAASIGFWNGAAFQAISLTGGIGRFNPYGGGNFKFADIALNTPIAMIINGVADPDNYSLAITIVKDADGYPDFLDGGTTQPFIAYSRPADVYVALDWKTGTGAVGGNDDGKFVTSNHWDTENQYRWRINAFANIQEAIDAVN